MIKNESIEVNCNGLDDYYIVNFENNMPLNRATLNEKIQNIYHLNEGYNQHLFLNDMSSSLELAIRLNKPILEKFPNYNSLFIGKDLNIEKIKEYISSYNKYNKEIIVINDLKDIPFVVKKENFTEAYCYIKKLKMNKELTLKEERYYLFFNKIMEFKIINKEFNFLNLKDYESDYEVEEIIDKMLELYNYERNENITNILEITPDFYLDNSENFDIFYYLVKNIKGVSNKYNYDVHYIFNFKSEIDRTIVALFSKNISYNLDLSLSDAHRYLKGDKKTILFLDFLDFNVDGFGVMPAAGVGEVKSNIFLNNSSYEKGHYSKMFLASLVGNSLLRISKNKEENLTKNIFKDDRTIIYDDERPFQLINNNDSKCKRFLNILKREQ